MAGDLERFLQQAAERLSEKVNQGQQPRRPQRPQPPVRQAERARLDPDIVDAEIVEAEMVQPASRRQLGPDPLSDIDTRAPLAQQIGLADEKMAGHLQEAFEQEAPRLKQASNMLADGDGYESNDKSQVERRERSVSPLVDMLRQPQTLRAAFIASEIFRRKF